MSARYPFGPNPLPPVDPGKIRAEQKVGIAYSGGGDRVVIELGIAQAFIELGVVPHYIAGVSAGAFVGALHALDPRSTRYLPLALQTAQAGVPLLKPSVWRVLFRLIPAGLGYLLSGGRSLNLKSISDTNRLQKLLERRFPAKTFGELQLPLSISATAALSGREVWFEDPAMPIVPAMLASSAIPGVFPPYKIGDQLYIDGGTSDNLPLFHLAQKGCSLIYSCNVGYAGEANKPPTNLLDTILLAESIGQYAATLTQEALLAAHYPQVRIIPIRPEVALTTLPSGLNTRDIPKYVAQSAEETKRILRAAGVAG